MDCDDGGGVALAALAFVRDWTLRGRHAASAPLLLVARVSSEAKRAAAVELLRAAGIPHVLASHRVDPSSLVGGGDVLELGLSRQATAYQVPISLTPQLEQLRRPGILSRSATLSGVYGRWPAGAGSNSQLWHLTSAASDLIGQVPSRRWDFDPQPLQLRPEWVQASNHMAYVDGIEFFDHSAFHISKTEASLMDPQQRLLLEYSQAAREGGGLPLLNDELGVYLGISNADHQAALASSASVYAATGGAISIASGRISFAFGLQGPCASIDTACSSALVALHAGYRTLLSDEAPGCLVAAVSLMFAPHVSIGYARAGMLSTHGRCRTFDTSANGYVRGEGVGVTAITPPDDCAADLCAHLRGSAVRQDGYSASLTAPNGTAQAVLLSQALQRASSVPNDCLLIEAHGTGTPLGDPTEMNAIGRALATGAPTINAVKANAGHLEPAAGLLGLAKLVVALAHGRATPNAQLRVLNPIIASVLAPRGNATKMASFPLVVASLPLAAHQHVAPTSGVSSFGYSGTIAHAILSPGVGTRGRPEPLAQPLRRRSRLCGPADAGPLCRHADSMRPTPRHHSARRTRASPVGIPNEDSPENVAPLRALPAVAAQASLSSRGGRSPSFRSDFVKLSLMSGSGVAVIELGAPLSV